ncbi:MAG: hypothetical protein ACK57T_19340 [Dolichospermum sp.]
MPKTCSLFPVPCSLVITTIFNANLLKFPQEASKWLQPTLKTIMQF